MDMNKQVQNIKVIKLVKQKCELNKSSKYLNYVDDIKNNKENYFFKKSYEYR